MMNKLIPLAVIAAVLSGCASAWAPTRSAEVLNAEQMRVYREDLAAAERACKQLVRRSIFGGHVCVPAHTVVPSGTLPIYVVAHVVSHGGGHYGDTQVSADLYEPGRERERRRVLSHEWAHVLLNHYLGGRCSPAICERDADVYSVRVLQHAWGLTLREAVELVYEGLLSRLDAPAMGTHRSGCEEARAFAQAYRLPPPACSVATR